MLSPPVTQFQKVIPKKVSDFIFAQLEESIVLKEFLPEEKLPTERELASMFKVSRLAVREALYKLEQNGLIEKRVGAKGGTFARPLTQYAHQRNKEEIRSNWHEIVKVFEFRSVIEPETVYLAATRISSEELALLKEYVEKSIEETCPREMFRALDVKFHLSVAKASRNVYLEQAVRQIRTKINPVLDLVPYDQNIKSTNIESHMALFDALKDGDGGKAKEIMRKHIEATATVIDAIL